MHRDYICISNREDQGGRGEKLARLEMEREFQIYDMGCSITVQGSKRTGEFRKDFLET